jgi:hypothetical protein
LTGGAIRRTLAQLDAKLADEASRAGRPKARRLLAQMQMLAVERARLCTPEGLWGTGALPSNTTDDQVETLARRAEQSGVRSLPSNGVLLESDHSKLKERDARLHMIEWKGDAAGSPRRHRHSKLTQGSSGRSLGGSGRSLGGGGRTATLVAPEAEAEVPPLAQTTFQSLAGLDWGLQQQIGLILSGELEAERIDGETIRLTEGQTFSTPLPPELGELPLDRSPVIVSARVPAEALTPCRVLQLDFDDLAQAALAEKEAAQRRGMAELVMVKRSEAWRQRKLREARKRRDDLKAKCQRLRQHVNEMELRLGLRSTRDAHGLWLWALSRLRMLLAFGRDPGQLPSQRMGAMHQVHQCTTLAEQLAHLQKRHITLDHRIATATKQIHELCSDWAALQPPVLPAEAELSLDTEPYDLSQRRIEEARSTVGQLRALRERERSRCLERLDVFWEQLATPSAERESIRERAAGLDSESTRALQGALTQACQAALSPMMRETQAQLAELFDKLALPEKHRRPFRWAEGEPLTEEHLELCRAESARLEAWTAYLSPVLGRTGAKGAADGGALVSEAIGLLHAGIVKPMLTRRDAALELLPSAAEDRAGTAQQTQLNEVRRLHDEQLRQLEADEEERNLRQREALEAIRRRNEAQVEELETRHRQAVEGLALEKERMAEELQRQAQERFEKAEALVRERVAQEQRMEAYTQLAARLHVHLKTGSELLQMLWATDEQHELFVRQRDQAPLVQDAEAVSQEQVASLSAHVEALEAVVERLTIRSESDGLLIALRAYMEKASWTPRVLAKHMIDSQDELFELTNAIGGVLKPSRPEGRGRRRSVSKPTYYDRDPPLAYELIVAYLNRHQITFTPLAMSFFLQLVGTSAAAAENGGLKIKTSAFCHAFAAEERPESLELDLASS